YASQFVPDLLASYGLALPAAAHAQLAAQAAFVSPGAGGLVFLPYLNGERAPIWDTAARGVFFGISSQHRHRHFARAVLEGVAFSLRQILEVVEAASGQRVAQIVASGGPAAMPLWNEIKASVLNRPVMIPQVIHAACLGAAMLAAVGAGWHADAAQAAGAMVYIAEQVAPDPQHAARYDTLYPLYTSLYPQLQRAYAQLAEFNQVETGRL
ncbi:MAG: FGGY-family carbohydrate kinase, partial [Burkholderiaceae bacterium]